MPTNSSGLTKIRCRFIDKQSNKPVKGVIASLAISLGDGSNAVTLPHSTLSSDATGYMSFDIKAFTELGKAIHTCLISAPGYGLEDYDLFASTKKASAAPVKDIIDNTRDLIEEARKKLYEDDLSEPAPATLRAAKSDTDKLLCLVFPIYVDVAKEKKEDCGCSDVVQQTLPSIQNPDTCDYNVSPFSFVNPAAIKLGNDSCESIIPSSLPLQQYHFYKIVVRNSENNTGTTGPAVDDGNINVDDDTFVKDGDSIQIDERRSRIPNASGVISPINITSPLSQPASSLIKFCEILDYKQSWFSLGHSLGEIKYSLPLAPGESTQLAVIEWSRQDTASRKDGITATEYLDHDSRRERSIEDTVKAALSENQDGWSVMGGTSAAVSIPISEKIDLSANAAFGGSVSHSSGNRNVEGDSLQDLHDRVRQSSAYIRSLTSTVIVQSNQAENNSLQTRRVANHNHCHALTIQYYEVLRHYSLKTEFKGKRNAVLIPFSIFRFTEDIALRFREAIAPMLLDASLKDCFDALLRLKMPELYPTRYATVVVKTDKNKTNAEVFPTGLFVKKGDAITFNATGEMSFSVDAATHQVPDLVFGPDGNKTPPDSSPGSNSWFCGTHVNMFSLGFKIGGGAWQQGGSLTTTIADADGEIFLVANDVINTYGDNKGNWTVNVMATTNKGSVQIVQGNVSNGGIDTPKTENAKTIVYKPLKVDGQKRLDQSTQKYYGTLSNIKVKTGDGLSFTTTGRMKVGDGYSNGYTADGKNENAGPSGMASGLKVFSLIYKVGHNGNWHQCGTNITDNQADSDGELIFMLNEGNYDDNEGEWEVTVSVTTPIKVEVSSEVKNPALNNPVIADEPNDIVPAIKDKLCSLKLLTHLNSNQGYYNRIVWTMMDTGERRLYLENALGNNRELLNIIDDMPLAVTGNSVAFPCDLGDYSEKINFQGATKPGESVESIVCFPTRGLFAEAQMGHCNSCEERDITRMWDWNEMTTETPPEIGGITPGPKGTSTNVNPTQLPGNVIQITQPQNAPDPTGLANALTLLGNGNAFRDMSGLNQVAGLLGQLSKESNESHIKAMAKIAQDRVNEMRRNGGNGSGGGSTSGGGLEKQGSRPTATERVDNLKAAKAEAGELRNQGASEEEAFQHFSDMMKSGVADISDQVFPSYNEFMKTLQQKTPVIEDEEKFNRIISEWQIMNTEFSNSDDINFYFSSLTGSNTYLSWLKSNTRNLGINTNGTLDIKFDRKKQFNFRFNNQNEIKFNFLWDNIDIIFGHPINLFEFLALDLITHVEGYGDYQVLSEVASTNGTQVGLKYFYESISGTKASYNQNLDLGNITAGKLFQSQTFKDAHQASLLLLENNDPQHPVTYKTWWNPNDPKWNSASYPAGVPFSQSDNLLDYIKQCDFYKFRGRGYIQTTGRNNYKDLIAKLIETNGTLNADYVELFNWQQKSPDVIATTTTISDWDSLFNTPGSLVPHAALNVFADKHNKCFDIKMQFNSLYDDAVGTIAYAGTTVNGYGAQLSKAVRKILLCLYNSIITRENN